MITIYDLKPKFQGLLRPCTVFLANKGITANQVTWSALVLSFLCGLLVYLSNGASWALLTLPFVLFLRMALNAIDGMLAREHNMKSMKGAMLNEMTDVIADTLLYMPFALVMGVTPSLLILFVIIGIFTEMAGVVALAINNDRRYDGPMGKSDRAFVMGLLAILLSFDWLPTYMVTIYLSVASILGLITLYKRMNNGIQ
ncbi:CDP-alcohol phosphatidyltransferase family protein [Psychromonas sp. PT13]|uniref:CDP-alcohol phosphatidyltransferase family protein n=1 Tax=Psychromonas sp. PT13 TaxID=3439547 RepID=UPI003EB986F8